MQTALQQDLDDGFHRPDSQLQPRANEAGHEPAAYRYEPEACDNEQTKEICRPDSAGHSDQPGPSKRLCVRRRLHLRASLWSHLPAQANIPLAHPAFLLCVNYEMHSQSLYILLADVHACMMQCSPRRMGMAHSRLTGRCWHKPQPWASILPISIHLSLCQFPASWRSTLAPVVRVCMCA